MSVYLTIGEGEPQQIATNSGWGDFCHWVDTLSVEDYRDLIHLVQYGWTEPGVQGQDNRWECC